MKLTELQKLRVERKWTRKRLAEEIGVGVSAILRWENGTSRPRPWAKKKLNELFDPPVAGTIPLRRAS